MHVFPDVKHLFVPDATGDFLRYRKLPSGRLHPAVLRAVGDWLAEALR